MTIDFYQTGGSSPCRAVYMTAKHLGISLNVKDVDMMKGEHLTPEFLKLNPNHTVPTLVDDGLALWESRAIMTYLANKYAPDSNLYPKDPASRVLVDKALYFDAGSLYPALADNFYGPMFRGLPHSAEKEEVFKTKLVTLDTLYLGKNKYVAGKHVTLADLSIFAALTFLEVTDFDFSAYPNITAWLKTLKAELPYHAEINEKPLTAFKAFLNSKK